MVIDMNVSALRTLEQIREFLAGTSDVVFSVPSNELALRTFIEAVLFRFRYVELPKGQRGVLYRYMQRVSSYSCQHLDRLIVQYRETKSLKPLVRSSRTSFKHTYSPADVALASRIGQPS
jgi:hypothetical protein